MDWNQVIYQPESNGVSPQPVAPDTPKSTRRTSTTLGAQPSSPTPTLSMNSSFTSPKGVHKRSSSSSRKGNDLMCNTETNAGTMWELLEVQIQRVMSSAPRTQHQLTELQQHNQALAKHLDCLTKAVAKLQAENEILASACKRAEINIGSLAHRQQEPNDLPESLVHGFDEDPMTDVLEILDDTNAAP